MLLHLDPRELDAPGNFIDAAGYGDDHGQAMRGYDDGELEEEARNGGEWFLEKDLDFGDAPWSKSEPT